jgi:ABC-type glycerol-3-phosphate transport system substrate-binding protein
MAASPHWVTSSSAGRETQAVQLLAFLAGEYTQGLVADKRGHTPVLKTLQTSSRYLVTPPTTMKVVSETIPYLTDQRFNPRYTEWRAAVTTAMAPAMAGARNVADSLREATRLGDLALAGGGR